MTDVDAAVNEHYAVAGLMDSILEALDRQNIDLGQLAVDDLTPIDAFHTRGRQSTCELAALGKLTAQHQVLDVGCGLGGTARYLAERFGCRVTGVDLSAEYIAVASRLNSMVGLTDRVSVCQGQATHLPFDDQSFDVVWTEHTQMNIPDKRDFYSEVIRVLRPGGQLLFHDVFAGSEKDPWFPTPWADRKAISFLVSQAEARRQLEQLGMSIENWIDKVDESIEFFDQVLSRFRHAGPPPLGLHLLMGANAVVKLSNYLRNLREQRATVAMGLAVNA